MTANNTVKPQWRVSRSWPGRIWYQFCRAMLIMLMTVLLSARVRGSQHLRRKGALLVLANHQSFLDPVLVAVAAPRQLCFLARKTLYRNPLFAWLISSLNAAPIDHEGIGIEGLRIVMQRLKENDAVNIFPEGERSPDGDFSPMRPGILLVIRRVPATIIPVGVAGAYDAWPRWRAFPLLAPLFLPANKHSVAVSIGKPYDSKRLIDLPRDDALGVLHHLIKQEHDKAEQLRRKP